MEILQPLTSLELSLFLRMVIRIRCDATSAFYPMGAKFGCEPTTEAPQLLKLAASLGVNVSGVSFHVGSGCQETLAFRRAIAATRPLFDLGLKLGFSMDLLDLGGGFPGHRGSSITGIAQVVNSALDEYFADLDVQVIAEPGRFYTASSGTLAALVHLNNGFKYYINDGIYGSFKLMQHQRSFSLEPFPLVKKPGKLQECSVWGPTCDAADLVMEGAMLPPLDIGDWIIFQNMGAYTTSVASNFNGMSIPKVYSVISQANWYFINNFLSLNMKVLSVQHCW